MVDMNEDEIVRLFLKNGFQISKSALELISEDPNIIIPKLKKITPRPFIITEQQIKKVLDASNELANVKITGEYSFRKTPIHVDDYVKELSARYEKIKSLLLKQTSLKKLVSINKINPKTIIFSIVGLVREKNDDLILIEDPTGEIRLYFDKNMEKELENILLDDVVGAQCKKRKEKYYVERVFLADLK